MLSGDGIGAAVFVLFALFANPGIFALVGRGTFGRRSLRRGFGFVGAEVTVLVTARATVVVAAEPRVGKAHCPAAVAVDAKIEVAVPESVVEHKGNRASLVFGEVEAVETFAGDDDILIGAVDIDEADFGSAVPVVGVIQRKVELDPIGSHGNRQSRASEHHVSR